GNRRCRRGSYRHRHVAFGPRTCPASSDPVQDLLRDEMNNTHEQIRELLHAYVDDELDPVNAREIQEHLNGCDGCRSAEKQIRSLRSVIKTATPAYLVPARLRKEVRAAVRREAKSTREISLPWWMAITAFACALLLFAVALFQPLRASRN